MMFVFAYIAQSMGLSHNEWPLRLIYLTEAAFVIVTFVCVLLAERLRVPDRSLGVMRSRSSGASVPASA